jgi:hypothetical protein
MVKKITSIFKCKTFIFKKKVIIMKDVEEDEDEDKSDEESDDKSGSDKESDESEKSEKSDEEEDEEDDDEGGIPKFDPKKSNTNFKFSKKNRVMLTTTS